MKKQDTGLFGLQPPKGKELEEVTKRLLKGAIKPRKKRFLKDRFNLDNVYGPDLYVNVGKQIEEDGLLKPTMAETTSLVYAAFFNKLNKEQSNQIKEVMKDKYLWVFTGALYVPNKGVYVQDNPEIKDGMLYMEKSDLVKKLENNNKSVRFVPFGYKIGEMTIKQLAKNKVIIALAGKEGAEKLAKVAGKHKDKPHLWDFESGDVDEPIRRFFNVYSSSSYDNLNVDCVTFGSNDCGRGRDGCSFGIQKNTKEE